MTKNKFVWTLILFVLSLAAFFYLRLSNLNGIPVFVDEGIYVRWSQLIKTESSLRFIPQTDGKQPLFMWVTVPFFKINSDPLIAGRLVSVTAGLGTLFGLVFLTYVLFGDFLIASLAALVYAILPYTVFFDRMALADSLLAMFGIWSLGLSILFAKTRRLDHAMFLGFALGGGLLTKSPAIIFYVWLGLAIFFFYRPKNNSLRSFGQLIAGVLAALIISQIMYNILRLGPAFNMIGARNQDYVFTLKEVLTHPFNPLIGNLKTTATWFWLLFSPTIIATLIFGFLPVKTRYLILFLCLVSLFPLFGQAAIAKVYTSRYALFAVAPLIPVSALGFHWLLTRKGPIIKYSSLLLLAIPVILSYLCVFRPTDAQLPFDMRNGYLEEWTAGWGQKEIADYFIELETKGERVIAFTEGFFGTLPDGLQIYTEGHKNIIIVGSNPNVSSIPEGLVNTSPDNQRFLIVNKSRNHLPAKDIQNLQLIKEYAKPARADGSSEALQFYRYQPSSL